MNGTIKNLEFNWLVINTLVAAIGVGVGLGRSGAGALLSDAALPQAALSGATLFVIIMMTYPIASIYSRQRRGRELPWIRYAVGAVAGGCIAALLHFLWG